ncbi:MAG TPA: amidase family protein [Burkholderiales bacterium]|nr:amidase family protein [Burkholderiales bacterium]
MSANEKLLVLSAVELRRRIGSKQISPVELLEACIARIERINPAVNAVTAVCYDRARDEAKAAEKAVLRGDPLGLLHGLPTGIKDLHETAGLLTTFGSPLYRDFVPEHDNAMVARVRAEGAIVVGKTNTPEFGAGANSRNVVWGATGNPFDPLLNAGGSSGGSAVALACDMLPVCTGSDTGGSLRIPAAKCGVVGFRPSPGLVPVERRRLGWTPISVAGPMGRTVADTCLLLAAQAAFDDCDPLSYPVDGRAFAAPDPCDLGSLRVAYTEDFGISPVDATIRRVFRDKIEAMRHLFRSCDETAFDFGEADRCFDVIRAMNYAAGYREVYESDPASLGPNVRANYELAASMTIADVAWAHQEQTRIFRRFQQNFRDYDLVLAPTTPVSPFPWTELYLAEMDGKPLRNYYHWLSLTYVITLATNPAIALPCGVDHKGMPFGLQIVGPFRADRAVLAAAHAMEQAFAAITTLRRPVPDLSKLGRAVPALKSIVTHPPKASTRAAASATL